MTQPRKHEKEFKIIKWIWLAFAPVSALLALHSAYRLMAGGYSPWVWQEYVSGMGRGEDPGDLIQNAVLGYLPFYLSVVLAVYWAVEAAVALFAEIPGNLEKFRIDRVMLQCGSAYMGLSGLIAFLLWLAARSEADGGPLATRWVALGTIASLVLLIDGFLSVVDAVRRRPAEDSELFSAEDWSPMFPRPE